MHTDPTPMKKPTEDGNPTAGQHTNSVTVPGSNANDKTFATLAAQFAQAGHCLMRGADGGIYAARWGMVRHLTDLGAAKLFLQQIGGAA